MKTVISARQFQALLLLRDELHFGRAAVRLGVAQPHLSAMLRRVEEVAGFQIFGRRPVRLTPAGAVLLKAGAQMLADVEDAIAEARMVASGTKGIVRVGYIPTAMFAGLADAVTKFANEYPSVEVKLREASAPWLYEQFSRGDLDLVITRQDGNVPPGQSVRLFEDRMGALLPEHHPLSRHKSISLARLSGERFVFFRRANDPDYVDRALGAAQSAGLKPGFTQEVDSWSTAVALVKSGFGVTLSMSSYRALGVPGVRFCEVEEMLPDLSFRLLFNPDRMSASAAQFVTVLKGFT